MRKKRKPQEVTNLTLDQVTRQTAILTYARCVDAGNRPANHVGDWPEEGVVYPVHLVNSKMEGLPLVHVLGFEGAAPYFNAFSEHRFEPVAFLSVN